MHSIRFVPVLLCVLGISVAAISGCGQAPQSEPARGDGGSAPSVADSGALNENATEADTVEDTSTEPAETTEASSTLGIGDSAPPLAIDRWITGDPLESLESGQVYVVEFWATWCPPCRTSMPHLSHLQEQYGGQVKFVGVTREPQEVVEQFLDKQQSPEMTWREVVKYRLATDAQDATNESYMRAAGQSGIPTAFIVGREGVIEWIGHPMTMDQPLAEIVSGTWDREAALAQARQQEALKEAMGQLGSMMRERRWDEALELLQQVESQSGSSTQVSKLRLSVLRRAGRMDEAAKLQAEMVDQAWDDASELNEIAWGIATGTGDRDLQLAQKAALRASELSNHEEAMILDTVARVYYEQGRLDEAIQWQKKAVEHNQGLAEIEATLKKYESEKAARPPATDPGPAEETSPSGDAP